MRFDSLDKKLVRLLAEDGRMSASILAERLSVTSPTVRSRIKSLAASGLLKIAGLIDPGRGQELTTAIVGLKIQSHGQLDKELELLAELEQVQWAAVVTGRYDAIVEVVVTGGMPDLYRLMTETIPNVGLVTQTETFVVMKSRRKWVFPPSEGIEW